MEKIKPRVQYKELQRSQDKGIFLHQGKNVFYFNVCACGGNLEIIFESNKKYSTEIYLLTFCKNCKLCYTISETRAKEIMR